MTVKLKMQSLLRAAQAVQENPSELKQLKLCRQPDPMDRDRTESSGLTRKLLGDTALSSASFWGLKLLPPLGLGNTN